MSRFFVGRKTIFAFVVVLVMRYVMHVNITVRGRKDLSSQYFDIGIPPQMNFKDESETETTNRQQDFKHLNVKVAENDLEIEAPGTKCADKKIKWNDGTIPKYVMNPNLFLIPTLQNGPNNQIIGLQQSILVALLLNRTLVLPHFYEHAMLGVTFRNIVQPKYRINVQKLRQFISVIPLKKAVKLCNSKFDAVFTTKGTKVMLAAAQKLVLIEMETGLSAANYVKGVNKHALDELERYVRRNKQTTDVDLLSQRWWPHSPSDSQWMYRILNPDHPVSVPLYPNFSPADKQVELEDVPTAYKTNDKCALYWFPFREFHIDFPYQDALTTTKVKDLQNINQQKASIIHGDILKYLQPPEPVQVWADEFRKQALPRDYIALHWRFDEEDFFDYLCKEGLGRNEFCEGVRRAHNASAIATSILRRTYDIKKEVGKTTTSLYFATPPTIKTLVDDIKTILNNNNLVRNILQNLKIFEEVQPPIVISVKDLKSFLQQRHSGCDMTDPRQLPDTISQIEMKLCEESSSFLWSRQSTWSKNVLVQRYLSKGRTIKEQDFSVSDYTLKIMDGKLKKRKKFKFI
ncbi:uncharacterized protein LOC120333804 [Styela clava]